MGNGSSINVIWEPWISFTPIEVWPTLVDIESLQNFKVVDLILLDTDCWNTSMIYQYFFESLAEQF